MKTRDMTRAQFGAALKRHGFKFVMGCWIDIGNGKSIGMTCNSRTLKPCYRHSLSRALKEADKAESEAS